MPNAADLQQAQSKREILEFIITNLQENLSRRGEAMLQSDKEGILFGEYRGVPAWLESLKSSISFNAAVLYIFIFTTWR